MSLITTKICKNVCQIFLWKLLKKKMFCSRCLSSFVVLFLSNGPSRKDRSKKILFAGNNCTVTGFFGKTCQSNVKVFPLSLHRVQPTIASIFQWKHWFKSTCGSINGVRVNKVTLWARANLKMFWNKMWQNKNFRLINFYLSDLLCLVSDHRSQIDSPCLGGPNRNNGAQH